MNEIKVEEIFDDLTIREEIKFRVAEHQTLLSFNSDWQSEAFEDWLHAEGMNQFVSWLNQNREDYQ
jgi:hypothetical protein